MSSDSFESSGSFPLEKEGYILSWDEAGLAIQITDYHVKPFTISRERIIEILNRSGKAPSPNGSHRNLPDEGTVARGRDFLLTWNAAGVAVEVIDYHIALIEISWETLLRACNGRQA